MCLPVSWCSSLKVSCSWCKLQCQGMNCAGWGNGLGICGAVPAVGVAASCKGVERTSDCGCVLDRCICISRESELSHTILNLVKQDTPGWHMEIVVPASPSLPAPVTVFNRLCGTRDLIVPTCQLTGFSFDCGAKRRVRFAYRVCTLVIVSGSGRLIGCSLSRAVRVFNPLEKNYPSWW